MAGGPSTGRRGHRARWPGRGRGSQVGVAAARQGEQGVWRLTVQPVVPHLEVHFARRPSTTVAADRVIAPIRDLATELARD